MSKRALIIGTIGVLAVMSTVTTVLLMSGSRSPGSAASLPVVQMGVAPENPVEEVVEQAENSRFAMLSPLPSTQSQSMNCMDSNCTPGSSVGAPSTVFEAGDEAVDNPTIGVGTGIEEAILPSTNSASTKAALSVAKIDQRNTVLLGGLYASTLSKELERSADRVVATENNFLGGNFVGCTSEYDCPVVGAAGAEVTSFTKVVVDGTTATVTARVHGWQDDAQYKGPTVALVWHRIAATLTVKDTLHKQDDGSWQVVKRSAASTSGSEP